MNMKYYTFNEQANSNFELEYKLNYHGLKQFINYQTHINRIYKEFPIMKCFEFKSYRINDYIGEDLVPVKMSLTSYNVNVILNILYDRGLLDEKMFFKKQEYNKLQKAIKNI